MPDPDREPSILEKSGTPPTPGNRKPPSGQVKQLGDKTEGREPGHEKANSSIKRALHDVEFPTSRTRLVHDVGNRRIGLGGEQTVKLAQILERLPTAKFPSADAVLDDVNRQWDTIAELRDLYGGGGT